MSSELTVLNDLIYENEAIRQYIRSLKNAMDEEEALLLQKGDKLTAHQSRTLGRSQYHLQQSLLNLREVLTRHYLHEEKVLPQMVGPLLVEAFKSALKGIIEELDRDEALLHDDLRQLRNTELLARSYNVRRAIDGVSKVIEEHITKEDTVLELLKGALNIQKATNETA